MEWTRGPTIGHGSSAAVYLATGASGELFAVKSAQLSRSSFLQREQKILSQLRSPHVVGYLGFDVTCEKNEHVYNLLMEYVSGGTISDAVKNRGGSLDEAMIRLYSHQILQGLDYLHSNRLVHCDIKGKNLLIGKDCVKIADLGCARFVEDGDSAAEASMFSGTPAFMAPEVARGEDQGYPADVWALGCTLIEMATGSNPWPELNDPVSALYRIGYSGDLPEFPRWLSEVAQDFLSKCLKTNPKNRWTAEELLKHPFVADCEQKLETFTRNSPTAVLDQLFWDSLEASESSPDQTQISSHLNSPAERMRQLIGDASSSNSDLPKWAEEEDWITVRNNHTEESTQFPQLNADLEDENRLFSETESLLSSTVNQEELVSSSDYQILLLDSSVEEEISNRIDPLFCFDVLSDCLQLGDSLDFERVNERLFEFKNQAFHSLTSTIVISPVLLCFCDSLNFYFFYYFFGKKNRKSIWSLLNQ